MIEKIFYLSRAWKNGMISRLNLSLVPEKVTFADVISVGKVDGKDLMHLSAQTTKEYGSFSYEQIYYLHQLKAYQAVLEVMSDSDICPQGTVFWLKHPDYPEIVFETIPAKVELYKVYVVDSEMALRSKEGDSIMISVPYTGRVADMLFVEKIPDSVEEQRQQWLEQRRAY